MKKDPGGCGVPAGSFDREKKALARDGHDVVAIHRRLAAKIHGASWSSVRFDGSPRQDRKATIHWVGPMRRSEIASAVPKADAYDDFLKYNAVARKNEAVSRQRLDVHLKQLNAVL
jgi:hypothetical protein